MHDSLRFNRPIDAARPRGAPRLEAFSPKLGRRLSLYSRSAFQLWLCLESDPAVHAFCERPGFIQFGEKRRLAEFWVGYAGSASREEVLVLASSEAAHSDASEHPSPKQSIDSPLNVRFVQPAELAAARIWTSNWERMLPCVVANRRLLSRALLDEIVHFAAEPQPLSTIERAFSTEDPVLVRAAVFTLLHGGRLRAAQLHTDALSLLTPFVSTGKMS